MCGKGVAQHLTGQGCPGAMGAEADSSGAFWGF